MKLLYLLFCFFVVHVPVFAQRYVDGAGVCGGNTPCYTTIQAAVTAATSGQTVTVYPGTYTELVTIEKALTLQSTGGKAVTTIQYTIPGYYIAPIMIQADAGSYSGVTIGGATGKGFTIIGTDVTNDAAGGPFEAAAIFIGSNSLNTISNINISYNTITCNGDEGLTTYYKTANTYSNVTVSNNVFNGKTYISPITSGGYFAHGNVARYAIGINPGTSNFIFDHNTVTVNSGESNIGRSTIYAEPAGSSFTNNYFEPTFAASTSAILRLGGTSGTISCNYFSMANSSNATYYITPPAAAPYTVATVAANNSFVNPGGRYSGSNIYKNTLAGTTANSAYPAPSCSLLPVTLTDFDAVQQNNRSLLTWATSSEQNTSQFIIEHSANGINYGQIGAMPATGNSSTTLHYSFIHNNPVAGANYYRLKISDIDGRFTYSPIRVLNFGDNDLSIITYPNPVKDKLTITGIKKGMQLRLINNAGQPLIFLISTGSTMQLDMSKLPKGIYLLQVIQNNGEIKNSKVIK